MFIAVKNSIATDANTAQIIKVPEESWIARFLVSPKTVLTYVYAIFGALIVLTLALDTFIEIRRSHLVHFVYALLLWIPLFAILYAGGVYLLSPQTPLTYVYIGLTTLIVLALAIQTFVEIRRKHLMHTVYALLLWILLSALLYMGQAYIFPTVVVV